MYALKYLYVKEGQIGMLLKKIILISVIIFVMIPSSSLGLDSCEGDEYDYSDFDRSLIPVGEKLTYNAYILGQFLPIGKAELSIRTLENDGRLYYLFSGDVTGGYLIFSVRMQLRSYIDYETLRPMLFTQKQEGFETKERKLIFDWQKKTITYFKKDFLNNSFKKRSSVFILPHTRDILTTLYFARSITPVINAQKTMNMIEKREVWTVTIEVIGKEKLSLQSGEYDALRIKIVPLKTSDNKIFRGLFGIEGEIILWVTEDKRIPLLIEGTYVMGFIPLHVKIVLQNADVSSYIKE